MKATRPVTGRTVLFSLLAFFGVVTLANAIMIRAAVTTFGGVETASSYQAGLAFARENAAVQEQDARHWQVKADVRASGTGTAVDIDARDADGRPLMGLAAHLRLSHPTDRRADETVALSETTPGCFRGIARARAGQWDVVIELSRDGDRLFRSRNRIVLR
jgi:nitrogen fixation protein FixH